MAQDSLDKAFSLGSGQMLLLSIIFYWQVITGVLRAAISCCKIMLWILQVISLSQSNVWRQCAEKNKKSLSPLCCALKYADAHRRALIQTCWHSCTNAHILQCSSPLIVYLVQPYFRRTSLSTHFPGIEMSAVAHLNDAHLLNLNQNFHNFFMHYYVSSLPFSLHLPLVRLLSRLQS